MSDYENDYYEGMNLALRNFDTETNKQIEEIEKLNRKCYYYDSIYHCVDRFKNMDLDD